MSVSAYDHDHVYLASGTSQPQRTVPNGQLAQQPPVRPNGMQRPAAGYGIMNNGNIRGVQSVARVEGYNSTVIQSNCPYYHPNTTPQINYPVQNLQQVGSRVITNVPQGHGFNPNSLNLSVPIHEQLPPPESKVEPSAVVEASVDIPGPSHDEEIEEPGDIDIQIRNVVCNYTLPLHIDLRKLALLSNNVTFDRGRGVLLKQKRNPNCYVKIYNSGKVYIVGCKSEIDCMRAARTVARHIQRAMDRVNETVKIRNYKVCNVLATCRMPFGIKIEELAQKHPQNSQYEPELSVGLVWRSQNPKATLRIHTTGSITVTGASSERDVQDVLMGIFPIVQKFQCSMRHRPDTKKRPRKRGGGGNRGGPSAKRCAGAGGIMGSGAVGNKLYFSDEDDIYDDEDLDDIDE